MKIAYITIYDYEDIRKWSGTGFYMAKALEDEGIEVERIGALKYPWKRFYRAKSFLCQRILRKRHLLDRATLALKSYGRQVSQKILKIKPDVIFSPSTLPVAYLDTEVPIVFWADSAFAGIVNYYPDFSNLCPQSLRNGNQAEQAALNRASAAIYSSQWAADGARQNYRFDHGKIRIVPFGANLKCAHSMGPVRVMIDQRPFDTCRLLFLGVDWMRKGGLLAIEVLKRLNESGLKAELSIVGCVPSAAERNLSGVKCFGFIDKSTREGCQKIEKLIAESHYVLLPSSAECSPIALCEANALGVPCLATPEGGIPDIIADGRNGRMFPSDSYVEECCKFIKLQFIDPGRYRESAFAALAEYQNRLNWETSAREVKKILEEILSEKRESPDDRQISAAGWNRR